MAKRNAGLFSRKKPGFNSPKLPDINRLKFKIEKFSLEFWETRDTRKAHEEEKFALRFKVFDFMRGLAMILLVLASFHGMDEFSRPSLSFKASGNIGFIDLSLPFFVLTMGAAIPISLSDRITRFGSRNTTTKIITRVISIFILGLVTTMLLSVSEGSMLVGPLQIVAILYLISSFIYYVLRTAKIKEVAIGSLFLFLGILTTLAHMLMMSKHGYTTAEGIISSSHALRALVGTKDMPHTFLSAVSATAVCFYGCFIGTIFTYHDKPRTKGRKRSGWKSIRPDIRRCIKLIILSILTMVAYFLLKQKIPPTLGDWSASYVLLSLGVYCVISSFAYFLLDVCKFDRLATYITALGANSTIVFTMLVFLRVYFISTSRTSLYLGRSISLDNYLTYDFLARRLGEQMGSLVFSLIILYVVVVLTRVMYSFKRLLRF